MKYWFIGQDWKLLFLTGEGSGEEEWPGIQSGQMIMDSNKKNVSVLTCFLLSLLESIHLKNRKCQINLHTLLIFPINLILTSKRNLLGIEDIMLPCKFVYFLNQVNRNHGWSIIFLTKFAVLLNKYWILHKQQSLKLDNFFGVTEICIFRFWKE